MKIAVVEDESKLRATLKEGLEAEGYDVEAFPTGEDFENEVLQKRARYGVILLDLMLPGMSGLDICRDLRMRGVATPILILTARSAINDKVELLDAGADDFMTKPFSLDELLARLRSLARRPIEIKRKSISIREITLDMNTQTATQAGKVLPLTSTEFDLLHLLFEHCGKVLTRDKISTFLWGADDATTGNTVEVHISNLRKKITHANEKEIIQTIRGAGYLVQK